MYTSVDTTEASKRRNNGKNQYQSIPHSPILSGTLFLTCLISEIKIWSEFAKTKKNVMKEIFIQGANSGPYWKQWLSAIPCSIVL